MSRVLCSACGDVIGVYEPVIVASGGTSRSTSLVNEPDLGGVAVALYHEACDPSQTLVADAPTHTGGRAVGASARARSVFPTDAGPTARP